MDLRRANLECFYVIAGVESVRFDEEREDEMVVIGKGVDAVTIVGKLRKKVGKSTKLLSVEDLVD